VQKLHSVQVLRAVAACAVVALHAYGESGNSHETAFRLGAAGVDLFFVISGFIMAKVSAGKLPSSFLAARIWRIYPLWLIAVLPWLKFVASPQELAASLTLWPVYGAYFFPALKLGWTLSFEMLFYLAMALSLRTNPLVPLGLFVVAFIGAMTTTSQLLWFLGSPMIFEFLFGVTVARLPKIQWGWLLIPLSLLMFAWSPLGIYDISVALTPQQALPRVILWGGPAALLVYGSLHVDLRRMRLAVLLGDASYSIYLFHLLAIRLLDTWWPVEIIAGVALGVAVHFGVERVIMRARPWRSFAPSPA
jgi:exopolysaccharide production protein ExoZ